MAKERIYPFAVASVRSMENKLLTKQKLLQMAEAKDAEEALRFLQDSDYGKTQIGDVHEFETMIQANLEEAYQAMGKLIPNEVFMDIFRFKNDYHNVKVLIKEEISKVNGRKFLIQGGSIPVEDLRKFFRERNYMEMPCIDEKAVEEAIELYAKTKNGRYIDTTLDRACFRVMSDAAEKLGIPVQDAVRSAGSTNGAAIHLSEKAVPVIVIGVPVRYAHTHYGISAYADFDNAVKLACEILKRLDEEQIRSF